MTVTADEEKIIQRARRWDETRKAKALAARNGSSPQEKAQLDRAHWVAGNELSEAIEKTLKPP
ncbi:hypothetical protein [Janthinobacterium sp. LB2P10]|uniref:hypothetical protein n=1 Tax=Janthinobacterium sp. LB2P10 TaxID=3424194 RepID=UPI003F20D851